MLKKCLKHEWKACWKNMALLNGAAIFMGALGGFGFLFSQLLAETIEEEENHE